MVRVSIRVRVLGVRLCIFTVSPPVRSLFTLPSRYFCAIGLPAYLALDAATTRSRCATRQRYSLPARARGYHPLRPRFPSGLVLRATTPEGFPLGLLPVQSPLLGESTFVSSPVPSDMLKSRTSSRTPCVIRTAATAGRLSHAAAFVIVWGAHRSHTEAVPRVVVCRPGPQQEERRSMLYSPCALCVARAARAGRQKSAGSEAGGGAAAAQARDSARGGTPVRRRRRPPAPPLISKKFI